MSLQNMVRVVACSCISRKGRLVPNDDLLDEGLEVRDELRITEGETITNHALLLLCYVPIV
jgi:hypothetical protein